MIGYDPWSCDCDPSEFYPRRAKWRPWWGKPQPWPGHVEPRRPDSDADEALRRLEEFLKRREPAPKPKKPKSTPERDALIDIAYDTATIEAAQKRALEALKGANP